MRKTVYLDNHATTPVDPRVLEAMLPYFAEKFGNAASRSHSFGWEAEKGVDRARRQVAELAGAAPREIVFTSGATESVNLAMKGAMRALRGRGNHLITTATEHRAVLDSAARLERDGYNVTVLPSESDGRLDPDRLRAAMRPDTILVSVMHANNEIGTLQPVEAIGAICREHGVLFHCDAAQAFGKVAVNAARDADLMSLSAHKLYGPKGVGALVVRRAGVRLQAEMDGGGHEGGMRSGTLNVPGIVGFGEACRIAGTEMAAEAERLERLRNELWGRLQASLPGVTVNGTMEHRLPGNLNVTFQGLQAGELLMKLPDLAISTGSACSSAVAAPSHVLLALGLSAADAKASVRFGLGRLTTGEEMEYVAIRVIEAARACYNARVFPVPQDPGNHYA